MKQDLSDMPKVKYFKMAVTFESGEQLTVGSDENNKPFSLFAEIIPGYLDWIVQEVKEKQEREKINEGD